MINYKLELIIFWPGYYNLVTLAKMPDCKTLINQSFRMSFGVLYFLKSVEYYILNYHLKSHKCNWFARNMPE